MVFFSFWYFSFLVRFGMVHFGMVHFGTMLPPNNISPYNPANDEPIIKLRPKNSEIDLYFSNKTSLFYDNYKPWQK